MEGRSGRGAGGLGRSMSSRMRAFLRHRTYGRRSAHVEFCIVRDRRGPAPTDRFTRNDARKIEVDPMPRFRTCLTLLVATSVVQGIAQAQASSFVSGDAVGVTVQAVRGFEGFADDALAVGLHFTFFTASGPDFDFGIATTPTILGLLAPDVGIGHTFPIGGGALMLKAGPSAVLLV